MLREIVATSLISLSLIAGQNSAELNVNNEDFQIKSDFQINKLKVDESSTEYYVGVDYLSLDNGFYKDEDEGIFGVKFYARNHYVNSMALSPYGNFERYNAMLAFGMKAVIGHNSHDTYYALPFFAELNFRLSALRLPNVTLNAEAYYAPSPLSFHSIDSYMEYKFYGEVEAIDNVSIVAGYRNIDIDFDDIDTSNKDSIFGGLKIYF